MQKGFTIIELLIVIAVIGILAAIAIPRMGNSVAEQELTGAAQQLVADLRELQQRRVNDGDIAGQYKLVFDASGRFYILNGNVNGISTAIKTVNLPASVAMQAPPSQITFTVNGTPSGGGNSVTLRSNKLNKNVYVYVAGATGRVRWSTTQDTNPSTW